MNNSAFLRKAIYGISIAILLIPLSMISRPDPRTVSSEGLAAGDNKGGKLAQLRDEHDLSQAKLMEIDPASETMKLASVGLRGVAVNVLWMQAMEHKKKQNWDKLRSTLNALIKIQPNFIKVWEYQAHNLSYNISVEFDDYEYRYYWVKEGIRFLTEGLPYNYRNHRITDNLGLFTGSKIGRSDERTQFRRLFRRDSDFHNEMYLTDGRGVDPDLYDTREYGHDNWKMAYQWFDKSRLLVEKYPKEQYLNDMMFYRKRPMQLMSQARSLQQEYPTDDIIQEIWRDANREWEEFGRREIRTSKGLPITFRGLAAAETRLVELRQELDQLVPGYRAGYMTELRGTLEFSPAQNQALDVPPDERTEEQSLIASAAEGVIQKRSQGIDRRIAENASSDNRFASRKLADQIETVMAQMQFTESYSETVNYSYWDVRSESETVESTKEARLAMYRAEEMKRSSIFDDEYRMDPETKQKKLVKQGGISLFEQAFAMWRKVLDEPQYQGRSLEDGEIIDDLMDAANEYYDMLRITGQDWPENFPFQSYIDQEAQFGELKLPTSQDVADRVSGRADADASDSTDGSGNPPNDPDAGSTAEGADDMRDADADAGGQPQPPDSPAEPKKDDG